VDTVMAMVMVGSMRRDWNDLCTSKLRIRLVIVFEFDATPSYFGVMNVHLCVYLMASICCALQPAVARPPASSSSLSTSTVCV